jgi:DNA-binding XRE family transcriptional regulator
VAGDADRVAHLPDSLCGGPLHRTFTRADNNLVLTRTYGDADDGDRYSNTIGGRIRGRRHELGLTQKETGEQIGVTESTINNWERERTRPAPGYREAILAFLERDPS